jgi:hypothetical protein
VPLVEIVGVLSLATDLGTGLPIEHAIRSCLIGLRLASHAGLDEAARTDVFYLTLLRMLGCTYRTGALPRSGAAVLGISSVISVLGFLGTSGIGGWLGSLFAIGIAAFAVGWIVLGWQAISLDRRVTAPGGV